ncbi:thiamine biosynthesis lipoprotein [Spirosomataceae bacterium TFI 002]|nr:thiamine biosynthesis lipoprotein [Spirosomataceae bacterium TFI 002]
MAESFKLVEKLMGNKFELCILHDSAHSAQHLLQETKNEISRIENLLSTFKENSQTNLINSQAGIDFVKVDLEVYELIERAIRISKLTNGAFDITYGGVDKSLWNFDTKMNSIPSKEQAKKIISKVDYRKVILDKSNTAVMLSEKGMRIGFGGIGKGYAADKARTLLKSKGIENGYINASGDLSAWGNQESGKKWTIGITDPDHKNDMIGQIEISELAVATSGNYEKFAVIDGKRYAHTIDPRTGLPASGIKSVTVICPIAELADAMCTPLMILGPQKGLVMVSQIHQMEALIIDENDNIYKTAGIKIK